MGDPLCSGKNRMKFSGVSLPFATIIRGTLSGVKIILLELTTFAVIVKLPVAGVDSRRRKGADASITGISDSTAIIIKLAAPSTHRRVARSTNYERGEPGLSHFQNEY